MQLSAEEIGELLVVLNIALLDATDDQQKELIRKWISRLSKQIGSQEES